MSDAVRQTTTWRNCACCDPDAVEAISRWLCVHHTGDEDFPDRMDGAEPGWALWADDAHCIIQFMGSRGLTTYVREVASGGR